MQNKRSKKMVSTLLVIVFATAFILVGRKAARQENNTQTQAQPSGQTLIAPDTRLHYTKHARCRMECRDITEAEVREVLQEGHINYQKSDTQDRPCPSYAIEDQVADGQQLRIVFGICDAQVSVITCIDLGQEHDCDCP